MKRSKSSILDTDDGKKQPKRPKAKSESAVAAGARKARGTDASESRAGGSEPSASVLDGDDPDVVEVTDPARRCDICSRCALFHYSFVFASGLVSYAYCTSNLYCTDCYNIWRTLYQKRMSLTLFPKHVGQWAGRQQFLKEMVAWLVLSREGSLRHVRKEYVDKMVANLNFAFELVGVPWPYFVVKEIDLATAGWMYVFQCRPEG